MKKDGFQYYKVDTDRYDDVRIRKLRRSYGTKGISVYDYLLAQVYRHNGCYAIFDDDCVFGVSEYFDIKEDVVRTIVGYCGDVGLFNKDLLDRDSVITSHAIQVRYIEMCKAARRTSADIPKAYVLIEEDESFGIPIRFTGNSVETEVITENFGKKRKIPEKSEKIQEKTPISKVKYSIEGDTSTNADVLSDSHESDTANATGTTLFGVEEVQEKQDSVNYEELAKYWNDTTKCVFGKVLSIDHNRRKMTSARIKEYGKDKFAEAIRKASQSEYLKSVAWFNFDWMIKPNNFTKLLEGNYDERKQEAKHTDPVGNTRTGGRCEGVHREREYE